MSIHATSPTGVTARRARLAQLALDGGPRVRTEPFPGWPDFGPDERAVAADVLAGGAVNYWTGGHGRELEREFAEWSGARHAVALANGTVALELVLHALGIGPGQEVIVPAATFIATASAVVAVGATPVVVDVDRDSQCLSAATVAPALTTRTAAVIVVHLAGWPADVEAVRALTRPLGVAVVEDCAQAHGARREGRAVGTVGDAAAWSFCQDKIMTTAGEGGAVTTDDSRLWRRCWERKDHGKNWDAVQASAGGSGFRWLHDDFGTNARMTEIQAAVGRRQLAKVDGWVARRRQHATMLRTRLAEQTALRLPTPPAGVEHSWYRFWLHLRPGHLGPGWDRDRVLAALVAEGVPARQGGCTEIHRERAFARRGRVVGRTPVAHTLGRTAVVLPVHPTLSEADVDDMATAVVKVLAVARSGSGPR